MISDCAAESSRSVLAADGFSFFAYAVGGFDFLDVVKPFSLGRAINSKLRDVILLINTYFLHYY